MPTLWDSKRRTIVNNESPEIIRMFNSAFNAWADTSFDFYPEGLRDEIDGMNNLVYEHLNNGVYRTGFAKTQRFTTKRYGKCSMGSIPWRNGLLSAATLWGSASAKLGGTQ